MGPATYKATNHATFPINSLGGRGCQPVAGGPSSYTEIHTDTLCTLLPVTSSGKQPIRHVIPIWDLDLSLKGLSDILLKKTSLVSLKKESERSPRVLMIPQGGILCPSDTPEIGPQRLNRPLLAWAAGTFHSRLQR